MSLSARRSVRRIHVATIPYARICWKDMNVNVWMVATEMQKKDVFAVMITQPYALGSNVVIMRYAVYQKTEHQSVIVLKIIHMEIQALNVSFSFNSFYLLEVIDFLGIGGK